MIDTATPDFTPEDKALLEEASHIIEKSLGSLTLMSDYMFTSFMQGNKSCMQVVLRAFTDDDSIIVTDVTTQYVTKSGAAGRGVRFDSRVKTLDGTIYLEFPSRCCHYAYWLECFVSSYCGVSVLPARLRCNGHLIPNFL